MNTKKILAFTFVAMMLASVLVIPASFESDAAGSTITVDFGVTGDQDSGVKIEQIKDVSLIPSDIPSEMYSGAYVAVKVTLDPGALSDLASTENVDFRATALASGEVTVSYCGVAYNLSGEKKATVSSSYTGESGSFLLSEITGGLNLSGIESLNNGGTAYAVVKLPAAGSYYGTLEMVKVKTVGEKIVVTPISPKAEFSVHQSGYGSMNTVSVSSGSYSGVTVSQVTSSSDLPEEVRSSLKGNAVAVKFDVSQISGKSSDRYVDFVVEYTNSAAPTNVLVNAFAVNDFTSILVENKVVGVGTTSGAPGKEYLTSEVPGLDITEADLFTYGGTAYAVINYLDGNYTASVNMVSYALDGDTKVDEVVLSDTFTVSVKKTSTTPGSSGGSSGGSGGSSQKPVDEGGVRETVSVPTSGDVEAIEAVYETSTGEEVKVEIPIEGLEGEQLQIQIKTDVEPSVLKQIQIEQNVGSDTETFVFEFSITKTSDGKQVTKDVKFTFDLPSNLIGMTNLKVGSVTDMGFDEDAGTVTVNGTQATVTFNHYSTFVIYPAASTPVVPIVPGGDDDDDDEPVTPITPTPEPTPSEKSDSNTTTVAVAAAAVAVIFLAALALAWMKRS